MTQARFLEHATLLAEVPSLVLEGPPLGQHPRPTVLLLHGLGASKEAQRKEAYSLADRGYRVVTLDAVGHGDRRYPDFEERFSSERAEPSFYELVRQTCEELPLVIQELGARGWSQGGLGACGISMGGVILFGAIAAGCPLDAVSILVATPEWKHTSRRPHEQLERFFPTALLVQTAGADVNVPPEAARVFCEALAPHYRRAPERLRYVEHPGESHLLSPEGWERAWAEAVGWFERFLPRT